MDLNKLKMKKELREKFRAEIFEDIPTCKLVPLDREMLDEILRTGIVILGGKGCGKSNVAKIITSEIIRKQDTTIQCKIIDKCQNWVHGFEPILYQELDSETESIYFGDDHILFNAHFRSSKEIKMYAAKMVGMDYEMQWIYKREGLMDNWILYIIEEAQNILGRYGLTGKEGQEWMTFISEGRNFNMNFIFIGQRAADIAAQAVERCQGYFFGKMTGDNDLKKIQRICGKNEAIHEIVPTLDVGQFIYWNGEEAKKFIDIPYYQVATKPMLWDGRGGI